MNNLEHIYSKIIDQQQLKNRLAYWNFLGQTIVFTNGCFDLIHRGHIEYLAKAAELGDVLIIGLNTDASVKRIKGENRPVQDQEARAVILASLHYVTNVILFDEDTPYKLITFIQPDVLVKGKDYTEENIVGYDVVNAKGGKVITIDYLEGYSTSELLNKLKK